VGRLRLSLAPEPPSPFGWVVSERPSEWLAVALARAIGHAVHVATLVTALLAKGN